MVQPWPPESLVLQDFWSENVTSLIRKNNTLSVSLLSAAMRDPPIVKRVVFALPAPGMSSRRKGKAAASREEDRTEKKEAVVKKEVVEVADSKEDGNDVETPWDDAFDLEGLPPALHATAPPPRPISAG